MEQVSTVLKRERERTGLTVRQLAKLSGLPTTTVFRIESGQMSTPKPEQLQRLARALAIDVEELYVAAGHVMPQGLPALRPYLRAKYGLSDALVDRVEGYVEAVREGNQLERKEGQHDDQRDQAP